MSEQSFLAEAAQAINPDQAVAPPCDLLGLLTKINACLKPAAAMAENEAQRQATIRAFQETRVYLRALGGAGGLCQLVTSVLGCLGQAAVQQPEPEQSTKPA
jgi:hypothetical protein